MPTEPDPIAFARVVHRAVEVVDPDGEDADLTDFLVRYEDADEPVTAIEDVAERLAQAAGALDPQQESGPLQAAVAVATYLAHRRDELPDEPDEIVRLAVRAEFEGHPPGPVSDGLALNEIDV